MDEKKVVGIKELPKELRFIEEIFNIDNIEYSLYLFLRIRFLTKLYFRLKNKHPI